MGLTKTWPILGPRCHPRSLSFRLYGILAVAVLALVALASAGMHFARLTTGAAHVLTRDGLDGLATAAGLEAQLDKHRQLVDAVLSETDRSQLTDTAAALVAVELKLSDLAVRRGRGDIDEFRTSVPELVARAEQVTFFAANGAADKARAAADRYHLTASLLQEKLRAFSRDRAAATSTQVAQLSNSAVQLYTWALGSTLLGVLVLAPLGILVLGDAARRLTRLWRAMSRLSKSDTTIPIPYLADRDEIGDMARAIQVFKDNAVALLQHKSELEQVNGWLDIALNNMSRGLSMFDADKRLVFCNAAYAKMYALPTDLTRRGTPIDAIMAWRSDLLRSERIVTPATDDPSQTLAAMIDSRTPATVHRHAADGREIAIAVQPLDQGGWVAIHQDVTQQRRAAQRITELACHDALTGLANRPVFVEELERRCRAEPPKPFAVLMIDLDHFKEINDTHGHPAGDALLRAVAARLTATVRKHDLVARLGGDEFAVIQDDVEADTVAITLAERIIAALEAPFDLQITSASISASIGIALVPRDGDAPDQVFGCADLALYDAKDAGRGRVTVFAPLMRERVVARRQLEADLRNAIVEGEFVLHYQPIVDLNEKTVVGCEALIRWRHPSRGMISPLEFIPLAEQTGLIVSIGRWALFQACQDALAWPAHVRVSVNLSAAQFTSGNLTETVANALALSGLAPGRLDLEVTESLLLADQQAVSVTLKRLRLLGVSIALDDFGTGYASLSYLRRFPFDKLKIDQTFVRDPANHTQSGAIVRAVAALAHSLDMAAVAEGVETLDHLRQVAAAGCDQAQGYLFSRPVPIEELPAALLKCTVALNDLAAPGSAPPESVRQTG